MDQLFQTRAMAAAVNLLKPVPTLILDKVFGKKSRQLTDRFAWDIASQSERILRNIQVHEPAQMSDNQGRKTITCSAPRFSEKRLIAAGDLNAMRAFGLEGENTLLKERIGGEQAEMKRKIDLTREFMAAKALSGQIIDDSGTLLVDFNFAASQKPVLTGTSLWSDPLSNPIQDLRSWKKQISQAVGQVSSWVAFVGSQAMDALIANPSALELLKYTIGKELAVDGRMATLVGVELVEYLGSYLDTNGVRQDLIPPTHFILVGLSGDHAAELCAPVIDFDAEGGVGLGQPGDFFFSKSWNQEDPSGRWIKVEARPLPVLFRPECVVYAQVV